MSGRDYDVMAVNHGMWDATNKVIDDLGARLNAMQAKIDFLVQHTEERLTRPCYHFWSANQVTGKNFCYKCDLEETPSACHDCTYQHSCSHSSVGMPHTVSECDSHKG